MGPSGAGKSTFIKMLTHELVPYKGSVIVNGVEVNKLKKAKFHTIGENSASFFRISAFCRKRRCLKILPLFSGSPVRGKKEIREKVNRVLDLVNLRNKANAYPAQLSGGEQQRVAIARALVNRPTLLIADEPTGNLDPATSEEIMDLFNNINHMGTTIIMVTHNKDLVNAMHKRVVSIEDGHIVSDVKKGGYDLHA